MFFFLFEMRFQHIFQLNSDENFNLPTVFCSNHPSPYSRSTPILLYRNLIHFQVCVSSHTHHQLRSIFINSTTTFIKPMCVCLNLITLSGFYCESIINTLHMCDSPPLQPRAAPGNKRKTVRRKQNLLSSLCNEMPQWTWPSSQRPQQQNKSEEKKKKSQLM